MRADCAPTATPWEWSGATPADLDASITMAKHHRDIEKLVSRVSKLERDDERDKSERQVSELKDLVGNLQRDMTILKSQCSMLECKRLDQDRKLSELQGSYEELRDYETLDVNWNIDKHVQVWAHE